MGKLNVVDMAARFRALVAAVAKKLDLGLRLRYFVPLTLTLKC